MISSFIEQFKNIDKKTFSIIRYGVLFSFVLSLIAVFILLNYKYNPIYIDTYYIGIQLFKTSLSFAIEFIVCGFATDIISKEIL